MREASTQAEPICSESYSARLNLLRGFLALCYPDEQRLNAVSYFNVYTYDLLSLYLFYFSPLSLSLLLLLRLRSL